ncbi:uncharacterized protein TrAFT101_009953 [Trichoderma asperellum]|uniref:uncharacterized protein n=1 Tax=Trichoderma asperellum TaxID=101201 RepID=UPI00332319D8|nr:hypothetical protein TrAFT101_009953 [Trichoderma asperellum]
MRRVPSAGFPRTSTPWRKLGTAPSLQARAAQASRPLQTAAGAKYLRRYQYQRTARQVRSAADPRLDPLALSHPSPRGSSFLGSPLAFTLLLYFLPAFCCVSHLSQLRRPCVSLTDRGVSTGLQLSCRRIIALASQSSYSGCWRINRPLNFQQPSVPAYGAAILQRVSRVVK